MDNKNSCAAYILLLLIAFGQVGASRPLQGKSGGEFVEQWSGFNQGYSPSACVLTPPFAYVGSEIGIDIVDVAVIDSPRIMMQLPLPGGQPHQLRLANDTLLLAITQDHLIVLNLTSPENPAILLDLNLLVVTGADMKGNFLFVSNSSVSSGGRVYTYDVSSWDNPILIGYLFWSIGFGGVRVVGDLLLTEAQFTDNIDFFIYRIDDLGVLSFLNQWTPPAYFPRDYEFVDTVGVFVFDLQSVVSLQTFALSQTTGAVTPLWTSGELVDRVPWNLSISDSTVCVYAINLALGLLGPWSILTAELRQDGALLFVDTLDLGLNRSGNSILYVQRPIALVDSVALWCTSEGIATGILVSDKRMIHRGFAKTHERCLSLDGMHDTLFVQTNDGLYVLDFTTATNPDTLGVLSLSAEGLELLNRTQLLTFDSVLTLIDVSDVRSPMVLDTLRLGRNKFGRIAASTDSLIAIACFDHGVFVVLYTNNNLALVSQIPSQATDVVWRGDTLLVSELENFMSIWDVGDPANPIFLSYLPGQSGTSYTLSTTDTILAVGTSPFVYLYDISSILDPALINQDFLYGGPILRYRFIDGLFYAYMGAERFSVFDLDDSLQFTNLATATYPDGDASFFVHDTTVFLSAGLRGLIVLELDTTIASIGDGADDIPTTTRLLPNYPNPFNSQTQIVYELSMESHVELDVFDMLGRHVSELDKGIRSPGRHVVRFDGNAFASGVYFCNLRVNRSAQVQRMILQK